MKPRSSAPRAQAAPARRAQRRRRCAQLTRGAAAQRARRQASRPRRRRRSMPPARPPSCGAATRRRRAWRPPLRRSPAQTKGAHAAQRVSEAPRGATGKRIRGAGARCARRARASGTGAGLARAALSLPAANAFARRGAAAGAGVTAPASAAAAGTAFSFSSAARKRACTRASASAADGVARAIGLHLRRSARGARQEATPRRSGGRADTRARCALHRSHAPPTHGVRTATRFRTNGSQLSISIRYRFAITARRPVRLLGAVWREVC